MTKAQWAGFLRGEKRPGDFLSFWLQHIFKYDEVLKQGCKMLPLAEEHCYAYKHNGVCIVSFEVVKSRAAGM